MESPASRPGEFVIPERSERQELPAVVMTMVMADRGVCRSNRTHQNSQCDKGKQNARNLHEKPSRDQPESAVLDLSLLAKA
jgi:hypothetical protein